MTLWQRLRSLSPRARVFVIITTVVVVLDQWTKYLCIANLTRAFDTVTGEPLSFLGRLGAFWSVVHPPRAGVATVLENFWHFRYVENPGAAWGFLARTDSPLRTPFFLGVAVLAMAFIVYYFRHSTPEQRTLRVALAMVLGGAIGNFIDRARLGYVIDFIDWHWYDKATWPTFNVADAGISVGVCLLLLFGSSKKAEVGKPVAAS